MDKTFSTLLDLARFSAAMLVFVHHSEQILKDNRLSAFASFGHDAVIFFFILSGFVIGYVSSTKEKTIIDYTIARSARLFSVALPSLILVCLLINIGGVFFPSTYSIYGETNWPSVLFSSLLFLNQSWLLGVSVPTNGPYWSVSYEAWYYAIFGITYYITGAKKYIAVTLAILVAGPKIILLMPIWISGILCFKVHDKLCTKKLTGYIAIALSSGLYLWIRSKNIDDIIFIYSANLLGGEDYLNSNLGFSKRFLPDFIIAALFVLLFYGIYMIRNDISWIIEKLTPKIKTLSAYTFSLYLLHFPLLVFFSEAIKNTWLAMLACLITITLIGYFTETRKHALARIIKRAIY